MFRNIMYDTTFLNSEILSLHKNLNLKLKSV